ncbi:rhodanese-like domain-containing protein [Vicingus serpentipes]|jgi:phage shock protein E|uniref:Rhodanese-like domain-containing protein n=1 Tax=Vicingus serpentipes TaxID=1926625 RepID=A0A5C6RPV3_9FLAO|nr:rhodanese-like domain-containing protein [Vicingus serpentipes]TXB63984.1 rhodanese-like domain-containing protein [Vicingus serpentipes]
MSYENVNLKEATIIDVRTPGEFAMGCVEGSTNIPLDQVPHKIEEFKNMKKPLVLCCASGGRSGQAVQFLEANGVDDIYNGGGWNMVAMRMI